MGLRHFHKDVYSSSDLDYQNKLSSLSQKDLHIELYKKFLEWGSACGIDLGKVALLGSLESTPGTSILAGFTFLLESWRRTVSIPNTVPDVPTLGWPFRKSEACSRHDIVT
jgi:hypothetical protein